MAGEVVIGVDIGGTKLIVGVVDEQLQVHQRVQRLAPKDSQAAVLDALTEAGRADLAVAHLAVREMPGSGTPAELLGASGIDAAHIADAARRLLAEE